MLHRQQYDQPLRGFRLKLNDQVSKTGISRDFQGFKHLFLFLLTNRGDTSFFFPF